MTNRYGYDELFDADGNRREEEPPKEPGHCPEPWCRQLAGVDGHAFCAHCGALFHDDTEVVAVVNQTLTYRGPTGVEHSPIAPWSFDFYCDTACAHEATRA